MNAGEVRVKVSADTSEFNRKIDHVNGKLRGLGANAKTVGGSMSGAFGGIAAAVGGVTAALGAATVALAGFAAFRGIRVNADIENANIALTTLTGSAEMAKDMIEDLRNIGAESPFNFNGLQKAAKFLLAMGIESKKVIPYIRNIGDAVAAVGGGSDAIERVSLAIAQISAKGKVSAEEMNQLAENGIPAWKILSEQTGKTVKELMKMSENGKLFAEEALPLIMKGMDKNFGGAMKRASETFDGMLEQMKEQADMVFGNLFEPVFQGLKKVMPKIIDATKELNEAVKTDGFAGLVKFFTPDFLDEFVDEGARWGKLLFQAIDEQDWEWLGRIVVEKIRNEFDALGEVTDVFVKWVKGIDWKKVGGEITEGIGKFLFGVLDQMDEDIGKALEEGDTTEAANGLGKWFGKVVQEALSGLSEVLSTIDQALADVILGAVMGIDWNETGKSATKPNGAAFWSGFFDGLFEGINFEAFATKLWDASIFGKASLLQEKSDAVLKETADKLKARLSTELENLKMVAVQKLTQLVTSAFNKWNQFKSDTIKKVQETVLNVISKVQEFKSKLDAKWDEIKSGAQTKFEQVKNAILDPIKSAKETITGIIADIKSAFENLKISIPKPKIPIPKFSFSKGDLLNGIMPKFSVSWHAKGGIATGASIIGVGEKGDEAIVPLSQKHRMRPFAQAIASMMPDNKGGDTIINYYVNMYNMVRNDNDIEKISNQLEKLDERRKRAGGVWAIGNNV